MRQETCPSYTFRIWIAGDAEAAKTACREFAMRGLCVAIQSVEYVYTMGAESGVCISLINYPRFPATKNEIEATALELGHHLCDALFQGSFSVEGPDNTRWLSRRDQAQITSTSSDI